MRTVPFPRYWERIITFLEQGNTIVIKANGRRPGLLDTAVFAYTWTVLDRLGESELAGVVNKFENVVQHATRVKELVYS